MGKRFRGRRKSGKATDFVAEADKVARKVLDAWKRKEFRDFHRLHTDLSRHIVLAIVNGDFSEHIPGVMDLMAAKGEVSKRLAEYADMTVGISMRRGTASGSVSSLHHGLMWSTYRSLQVNREPIWFIPSEDLSYKLLSTEIRGFGVGEGVEPPFDAFYIELPEGLLDAVDQKTGVHPIRTLLVSVGEKSLFDLENRQVIRTGKRELVIIAHGTVNEFSSNPSDDCVQAYFVTMHDSWDEVKAGIRSKGAPKGRISGRIAGRDVGLQEMEEVVARFVYNFMIYVGSAGAEVSRLHEDEIRRLESKKKGGRTLPKKQEDKLKRLRKNRTYIVGGRSRVSREFKEAVMAGGKKARKLTTKTLVRGHWKRQACGKGLQERKTILVKPYVRGKGLAEKVKEYHVK